MITSKDNPLIYDENGTLPPYEEESSIPSGVICIWSGSYDNIPDGWVLCNGTQGTPDLRDKFVLGYGNKYSVGSIGGEETHTLTVNEMPSHNHGIRSSNGTGSSNTLTTTLTGLAENLSLIYDTGGSQAHNNMPPYYVLCYIMKL